jgi:hypothetical protein
MSKEAEKKPPISLRRRRTILATDIQAATVDQSTTTNPIDERRDQVAEENNNEKVASKRKVDPDKESTRNSKKSKYDSSSKSSAQGFARIQEEKEKVESQIITSTSITSTTNTESVAVNNHISSEAVSDYTDEDEIIKEYGKPPKSSVDIIPDAVAYISKNARPSKYTLMDSPIGNDDKMFALYEEVSDVFKGKIEVKIGVDANNPTQSSKEPEKFTKGSLPSLVVVSADLPTALTNYFDKTVLAYQRKGVNKFLLVHATQFEAYKEALDNLLEKNNVTLTSWNHDGNKVGFGLARRAACMLGKETSEHKHLLMSDDTVWLNKQMLDEAYDKIISSNKLPKYAAVGYTTGYTVSLNTIEKTKLGQDFKNPLERQTEKDNNILKNAEAKKGSGRPLEQLVMLDTDYKTKALWSSGKEDQDMTQLMQNNNSASPKPLTNYAVDKMDKHPNGYNPDLESEKTKSAREAFDVLRKRQDKDLFDRFKNTIVTVELSEKVRNSLIMHREEARDISEINAEGKSKIFGNVKMPIAIEAYYGDSKSGKALAGRGAEDRFVRTLDNIISNYRENHKRFRDLQRLGPKISREVPGAEQSANMDIDVTITSTTSTSSTSIVLNDSRGEQIIRIRNTLYGEQEFLELVKPQPMMVSNSKTLDSALKESKKTNRERLIEELESLKVKDVKNNYNDQQFNHSIDRIKNTLINPNQLQDESKQIAISIPQEVHERLNQALDSIKKKNIDDPKWEQIVELLKKEPRIPEQDQWLDTRRDGNRPIVLNVNSISKDFVETNNIHWVGLKVDHDTKEITYIDPLGHDVGKEIATQLQTEMKGFKVDSLYSNPGIHPQYGNIIDKDKEHASIEGNDKDCGPFLINALNQSSSKAIRELHLLELGSKDIDSAQKSIKYGQEIRNQHIERIAELDVKRKEQDNKKGNELDQNQTHTRNPKQTEQTAEKDAAEKNRVPKKIEGAAEPTNFKRDFDDQGQGGGTASAVTAQNSNSKANKDTVFGPTYMDIEPRDNSSIPNISSNTIMRAALEQGHSSPEDTHSASNKLKSAAIVSKLPITNFTPIAPEILAQIPSEAIATLRQNTQSLSKNKNTEQGIQVALTQKTSAINIKNQAQHNEQQDVRRQHQGNNRQGNGR